MMKPDEAFDEVITSRFLWGCVFGVGLAVFANYDTVAEFIVYTCLLFPVCFLFKAFFGKKVSQ